MTLGTRPPRRPTRPARIRVHVEPYDVGAQIGLRHAPAPATAPVDGATCERGAGRPRHDSSERE